MITSQNHGFAVDAAIVAGERARDARVAVRRQPAGHRAHRQAGVQLPGPSGSEPRTARRRLSVRSLREDDGRSRGVAAMPKRTDIQSILDHRRRPDHHRPGVRVRLFGRAGVQGAARGGLSRHPRQLESGDDHDGPGDGRRHVHRADHLADGREHHRARAARCAAADDGRPDGAQLRARPRARRRADEVRRRADRRVEEGDRQGGGSREVQGGDDAHRPRLGELGHRAQRRAGAATCRRRSASPR